MTSSGLIIEIRMSCCNSLVEKGSSQEEEMKMTIFSHNKGLEESHKNKKKISKAFGPKGMSDEGFEKEVIELKEKS